MRETIEGFLACPCWLPTVLGLSWLVYFLARALHDERLKRDELSEVAAKLERLQDQLDVKVEDGSVSKSKPGKVIRVDFSKQKRAQNSDNSGPDAD